MITLRPAAERGHFDHGWLDTRHSFSFADYHDRRHMGFRSLRVINEDWIAPGAGFPEHPHRDMEIITYVISGALRHADSMGNGTIIRPGDVQRMSAGTGVVHSEFNAARDEPVHLLQIWLRPSVRGLAPSYEQKAFDVAATPGTLRLVASPDGSDGSVRIHQDVRLYASVLPAGTAITHALSPGRHAWIQVIRGGIEVNGQRLTAGDGAAVSGESSLALYANEGAELLLFDLA